jgi:hypothetical protein
LSRRRDLPKGKWSGGVQLVNFDRSEGFSDITDIGGMFAFGATRSHRDLRRVRHARIDADLVPSRATASRRIT